MSKTEFKDYYRILNVPRNATDYEIKYMYRKLALEYHPDRNRSPDAEERFKEITEAHSVLSDESKRVLYDCYLSYLDMLRHLSWEKHHKEEVRITKGLIFYTFMAWLLAFGSISIAFYFFNNNQSGSIIAGLILSSAFVATMITMRKWTALEWIGLITIMLFFLAVVIILLMPWVSIAMPAIERLVG